MNPAPSVLLLTTLTGFGYGFLAWLGLFCAAGALPPSRWFGPLAIVIALTIASAGLLASTLHLGRPERAWRAFSQWRSSWLSREGIAALLTYPPALAFATSWYLRGPHATITQILGLIAALSGLTTIYCTAMIYASLRPIRQWHNKHTAPDYLILALFSGSILLAALLSVWSHPTTPAVTAALIASLIAALAKIAYWRFIDAQSPLTTLAAATGLTALGTVRPLDQPHFTENYILREMGYQIARKHTTKLRKIAIFIAFALPSAFILAGTLSGVTIITAPLAILCAAAGLLIERWLFFAEATHVSTIYYGRVV